MEAKRRRGEHGADFGKDVDVICDSDTDVRGSGGVAGAVTRRGTTRSDGGAAAGRGTSKPGFGEHKLGGRSSSPPPAEFVDHVGSDINSQDSGAEIIDDRDGGDGRGDARKRVRVSGRHRSLAGRHSPQSSRGQNGAVGGDSADAEGPQRVVRATDSSFRNGHANGTVASQAGAVHSRGSEVSQPQQGRAARHSVDPGAGVAVHGTAQATAPRGGMREDGLKEKVGGFGAGSAAVAPGTPTVVTHGTATIPEARRSGDGQSAAVSVVVAVNGPGQCLFREFGLYTISSRGAVERDRGRKCVTVGGSLR